MVNTAAFGKRIQEIMKFYQVSASGFADAMGVGRSSISHILSGRNKPSLDFVMKIAEAYPGAELYWLLYGQGTFPKSEKNSITEAAESQTETNTPAPVRLADSNKREQDLFSLPKSEISNEPINADGIKKQMINTNTTHKEIDQIVFFYKDGTFKIYKN